MQVCFDPMSPPTHIYQCGSGHFICGTCRHRIKVRDRVAWDDGNVAKHVKILSFINIIPGVPPEVW